MWEKLEELIKNKKDVYMKVTPELSRIILNRCIKLGFSGIYTDEFLSHFMDNINKKYLFIIFDLLSNTIYLLLEDSDKNIKGKGIEYDLINDCIVEEHKKWEKLKKLINQNKTVKIKVNPDLSREIQEWAFSNGICWHLNDYKVGCLNEPYLYFSNLPTIDGKRNIWINVDDIGDNDLIEYDIINDCIIDNKDSTVKINQHNFNNFKKYLEEGMSLKVRVTPEISEKLQEIAFKKGYKWNYSDKNIRYVDKPFLWFDNSDKSITYCNEIDEDYFDEKIEVLEYNPIYDCIADHCKEVNFLKDTIPLAQETLKKYEEFYEEMYKKDNLSDNLSIENIKKLSKEKIKQYKMDLRDYFACIALEGLIISKVCLSNTSIAQSSYNIADDMLKERDKKKDN